MHINLCAAYATTAFGTYDCNEQTTLTIGVRDDTIHLTLNRTQLEELSGVITDRLDLMADAASTTLLAIVEKATNVEFARQYCAESEEHDDEWPWRYFDGTKLREGAEKELLADVHLAQEIAAEETWQDAEYLKERAGDEKYHYLVENPPADDPRL